MKMRLQNDQGQTATDRRSTAIQINYLPGTIDADSRRILLKNSHQHHQKTLRSSLSPIPCCRYRLSNKSTTNNGSARGRTQQELVRPSTQEVTYYLQRISIV